MQVLVVGGGGREHALLWRLRQSPGVTRLFCAPGNGGTAALAQNVPIPVDDLPAIADWAAQNRMDLVVVGPDAPLCGGLTDMLAQRGVRAFGPSEAAARIEGSKVYAKRLMRKYGIPTAAFECFADAELALRYIRIAPCPMVVKADGLALGKGVMVCRTRYEAEEAVRAMMLEARFGESGQRVVVEEMLEGPEVSVLALTDGETLLPLASGMDHKRALDGDEGPNTGGMGVIAPNPFYTKEIAQECERTIFMPTLAALRAEGAPFRGCLYFGLMLTRQGPKVIEYNCRFGDPEAQAVLPLTQGDFLDALLRTCDGTLSQASLRVKPGASCCVVAASGGYPGPVETGKAIAGIGQAEARPGVTVFHAGTRTGAQGGPETGGGRVLGVTAVADTLREAVARAYAAAGDIRFDGMRLRGDIGARALMQAQEAEPGR